MLEQLWVRACSSRRRGETDGLTRLTPACADGAGRLRDTGCVYAAKQSPLSPVISFIPNPNPDQLGFHFLWIFFVH